MVQKIFTNRWLYIGIAAAIIISVLLMIHGVGGRSETDLITTTVETGTVRQLVSVSGIAEAEQTAELAFPTSGTISGVSVKIGDVVQEGDILIQQDARTLYADRQDALAAVARTVADRDELLAGPTNQERDVTRENIATAEETLVTTRANEAQKIANAHQTLLSANLVAYPEDDDEDAVAPTISGTYNCEQEGYYTLELFSSNANSGYSYRLSGLESGTFNASVDQALFLGSCGLNIKFNSNSKYNRTTWKIDIPNTKSSSYVTNRNAHALAVTQAYSAIKQAEQAVTLAETTATNQNAPARSEAVTRANAAITQAKAKLNRIDVAISEKTLRAPFTSTVTELDILPGETVTTQPIVTLLASSEFEVTARIPEIDIGKLLIGQKTEMVFDARATEVLTGEISFISLKATKIDGVSYYEAVIQLDKIPPWIRSGLNADIEIILTEKLNSLRVPKRFVTETETKTEVLLQKADQVASTTITIELEGNDGYFAITGLNQGDIIVAPQ